MLLVLGGVCGRAGAQITPTEQNAEAMMETAAMTMSMLYQDEDPLSAPATLAATGTFSDTAWTLNLSGMYGADAVSIAFVGAYNTSSGTGSFTSTGTIGPGTWTGLATDNTYSYVTLSPTDLSFNYASNAMIIKPGKPVKMPDTEIINKSISEDIVPPYAEIDDVGTYVKTENGVITSGPYTQLSSWVIPLDKPQDGIASVSTSEGVYLTGIGSLDTDSFSGTVSVPEPVGGLVLALSAMAMLPRRRRGR
jgi:hypothetical protein